MKTKSLLVVLLTLFVLTNVMAQSSHENHENEASESDQNKHEMHEGHMDMDVAAETEAIKLVMKKYKDAVEGLTTEGTLDLFTEDAVVFESGGVEGTFKNYLEHHLGPELEHFNSFTFSDYEISVDVAMHFAFVTETYIYTIDIKANEERGTEGRVIKRKGVATSVLKHADGAWKIIRTHSSARSVQSSH